MHQEIEIMLDPTRPWQIIPKDSPIILFFYSQIFSLLFSQTIPLFLNYSQLMTSARPCAFKFNPKTSAFGKVNSLHAV